MRLFIIFDGCGDCNAGKRPQSEPADRATCQVAQPSSVGGGGASTTLWREFWRLLDVAAACV
jgi:hypothetical protein